MTPLRNIISIVSLKGPKGLPKVLGVLDCGHYTPCAPGKDDRDAFCGCCEMEERKGYHRTVRRRTDASDAKTG